MRADSWAIVWSDPPPRLAPIWSLQL
jgi:hypothetical protein